MSEAETLHSVSTEDAIGDVEKSMQRRPVALSVTPSELLSKEGFALYVGKTTTAVVAMAKAGKLPAFYMADPTKPGGNAELWVHKGEWDKYARQLVDSAPEEWHDWKNRISANKPRRHHAA